MSFVKTTTTLGIEFVKQPMRVRNNQGATRSKGDVMMFDLALSGAGGLAVANKYAKGDSGTVLVVDMDAAKDGYGLCVVLAEDLLAGQEGDAWFAHDDLLANCDGVIGPGLPLGLPAGGTGVALDATPSTGGKCIAISLATTQVGLSRVIFHGGGFLGKI